MLDEQIKQVYDIAMLKHSRRQAAEVRKQIVNYKIKNTRRNHHVPV